MTNIKYKSIISVSNLSFCCNFSKAKALKEVERAGEKNFCSISYQYSLKYIHTEIVLNHQQQQIQHNGNNRTASADIPKSENPKKTVLSCKSIHFI